MRFTLTVAATYTRPLINSLVGLAHTYVRFVTDQSLAAVPPVSLVEQEVFMVVGSRLGVSTADNRWTTAAFAANTFDEVYESLSLVLLNSISSAYNRLDELMDRTIADIRADHGVRI